MTIGDSFKFGSSSLTKSTNELTKSFEKLSSGKRINKASDDAAGLALVSALEAEVRTSVQASRNSLDGVSITSIADSALGQISDITSRQSELAAQSANGTLSDEQRSTLNQEYQQLEQEKTRIVETTQFNGVSVFEGSTLQVGNDGSENSQLSIPAISTASVTAAQDISSAVGAQAAITSLKTQTESISKVRGEIGAVVNRLDTAQNSSSQKAFESEAAASRIRDADVAEENAKKTGFSIKQQVSVALSAQAGKLNADSVFKLLKQ
jgi:flagellin